MWQAQDTPSCPPRLLSVGLGHPFDFILLLDCI